MRRFLYYIPGRPGVNASILTELGLIDRFEISRGVPRPYIIRGVDDGPAGSGCLVALGDRPPEYAPSRQVWAQARGYWVGLETPWPMPEDLVREVGISGHPVQLSDGKVWRVPVLHRWDETALRHVPNLPRSMRPRPAADGGGLESVVRPEFRDADLLAGELTAGFFANRTLPAQEAFDHAVDVLAVNYRVGPEEVGLLGVLNETDILRVLAIAIDQPAIEAQAIALQCEGVEYSEPTILDEE